MDSLYELAVKALLSDGCSVQQFNNLPPEIKNGLIPKIIENLSIIDNKQKTIDALNTRVNELIIKARTLENVNQRLEHELDRLRAHYSSNLMPRPRYPHPYNPLGPEPILEPRLNLSNSRHTGNFDFSNPDN